MHIHLIYRMSFCGRIARAAIRCVPAHPIWMMETDKRMMLWGES